MSCQVVPAGNKFNVTAWAYADDYGHTTAGPTGFFWSGRMVVGGTISASVRFEDGVTKGLSMRVLVRKRDQFLMATLPAFPSPQPDDSLPSLLLQIQRDTTEGVFGTSRMSFLYQSGLTPGSGPNADWWYLTQPPAIVDVKISINPGLYPGTTWYQAQDGRHGHCSAHDFDQFRAQVIPHEEEHQRRNFGYVGSSRARDTWEGAAVYISPDSVSVPGQARRMIDQFHAPIRAVLDSLGADWDRQNFLTVGCQLVRPANVN